MFGLILFNVCIGYLIDYCMKIKLFAMLVSALFLTACESNPPRPVVPEVKYDLRINDSSKGEIFIDDVGISLKPIMFEKANVSENLFVSYSYWNPRNPRENGVDKTIVVSLPAFEVQITNTTGQAVSFQKVAMRLVDDSGNGYHAQLKQDVVDFVGTGLDSMQSRGWAFDRNAVLGKVKSLKLLDKNYESLPGITEKRILAFDVGNADNLNAYRAMFKNTKYVRVMIYNVPVRFDQAGNVTKVAKFDYLFDVVKR